MSNNLMRSSARAHVPHRGRVPTLRGMLGQGPLDADRGGAPARNREAPGRRRSPNQLKHEIGSFEGRRQRRCRGLSNRNGIGRIVEKRGGALDLDGW
jgi:hypothetical protein